MEPTSSKLLQIPLATRAPTQHRLNVEKRSSVAILSSGDNDARVCARKIANGTNPPIQPPAAQRWSASPNTPSGCTGAAAAWLTQASETRRTTLSSQRTRIVERRRSPFLTTAKVAETNATTVMPNRSAQTWPNRVSNKTVTDAVAEEA